LAFATPVKENYVKKLHLYSLLTLCAMLGMGMGFPIWWKKHRRMKNSFRANAGRPAVKARLNSRRLRLFQIPVAQLVRLRAWPERTLLPLKLLPPSLTKRQNRLHMTDFPCLTHTIEVYRSTVTSYLEADMLLRQLHRIFPGWCISFDLEDCDRVLRVESLGEPIPGSFIACLLEQSGYGCELLPDQDSCIYPAA
jgi:hypothetical protein